METDESDESLVGRYIATGDSAAFQRLLERYIEQVKRMAASILGVRLASDVEDVVQEVFVRVHRGLASFRGDAKFSSWLFRVTYNQCVTHKKQRARQLPSTRAESWPELPAREGAPPDSLDTRQLRATLDQAIDQLPTEYQTALRLHYWFQVPIARIAEQMRVPENTIKSWLHRGRKLLAHQLGKQENWS